VGHIIIIRKQQEKSIKLFLLVDVIRSCGDTKVTISNNVLLSISIDIMKKKIFNLNDLINTTFLHWYQSFDILCEHCGRNDIFFKKELDLTKKILIILLISFLLQDVTKKPVKI